MSSDNSWILDTVGDFIHSPIWAAPIHTFIEARCAAFDYDDENNEEENNATSLITSLEEQMNIHEQYTRLVDALINSLGRDLGLNQDDLNKVCQIPTDTEESVMIDESFEQLYAARDFSLFQEMMRRKNLILQLQALVSLQLQWGLLKQSDTGDDLVLSLLMQATASSSSTAPTPTPTPQRQSIAEPERPVVKQEVTQKKIQVDYDDDDDVVEEKTPPPSVSKTTHHKKEKKEPKKPVKEEVHLPGLRQRRGENLDTDWYRNLRQNVSQKNNKNDDDDDDDVSKENSRSNKNLTPQSISAVPQEVLREKLRQLTDHASLVDEEAAAAIRDRKIFLKQQRDAIVEKQKNERAQILEQEVKQEEQQTARPARPQSAALARKAMATNQNTQQPQMSNEEINRRRAMADKLRREVVDKR